MPENHLQSLSHVGVHDAGDFRPANPWARFSARAICQSGPKTQWFSRCAPLLTEHSRELTVTQRTGTDFTNLPECGYPGRRPCAIGQPMRAWLEQNHPAVKCLKRAIIPELIEYYCFTPHAAFFSGASIQ
jgi:hypothetical protein